MTVASGGDGAPEAGGRVDSVDVARGVALVGMACYHLSWDLADFGFVSPILPFTPPMRLLSHGVACGFLALVGVSLALAHRKGLNLRAFAKRLAIVAGAAALVTAGSAAFAPGLTIWFGILHCIAAATLLALPLIEAPAWASLVAGAAAVCLPSFFHSSAFDSPALLWIGLGEALPNTLDWRPLLPWAGVALIGLGAARLPGALAWATRPRRFRARSAPARAIAFAGRHSLAVYLVHQPILIGLVWSVAASGVVAPAAAPKPDFSAFLAACEKTCVAAGRPSPDCATSCRCVADAIEESGAADRLGSGPPEGERAAELRRMADACMGR
ncbi:putative membrane protein [Roseiarcus fermentans]|uniref:Putative membrane protein n=1 Tax=Roseiarcus fermentans TaxID=1473586 RepID=A0A366F5B9_9HYPH|nr:heparan-alpha-glucosaminide N-acetyltransferase [Roseiarcus fermentans]RBP09841.1 putative membrane protein [Roseiarcus fermentans]